MPEVPASPAASVPFVLHCNVPIAQVRASRHQARKSFDEEGIKSLSESIRLEGLQNSVTIRLIACSNASCQEPKAEGIEGLPPCPEGGHWHLELVSGERRLRAVKFLGLPTIEAKIIRTVNEAESAAKGLVENLQREDLNPIDEAEGFQELNQLDPKHWNQPQIAQVSGKSQGYISQSLKLLKLTPSVLENIRRLILSRSHGLELCRLPTVDQQITAAEKAKGLTLKQTRKLIDDMLPEKAGSSGHPPVAPATGAPTDPLESLWPALREKVLPVCQEAWAVVYTPFTFTFKKEWGWAFGLIDRNQVGPKRVAAWLEQLAKGIREANLPDRAEEQKKAAQAEESEALKQMETIQKLEAKAVEIAKRTQGMAQKYKQVNQRAAELWLPKTPQEAKDFEGSTLNPRLPNTPQEWAEVEALAPKGPGAVYQWMLGEKSYWTQKAFKLTWQDLEAPDPISGCHQVIETLRQGQERQAAASSKPPAPKPPAVTPVPLEPPIDPKVAEMVARAKARRALL